MKNLSNIFKKSLLGQIRLDKEKPRVFIYITNLISNEQNINLFWQCLTVEEKIQAKKYYTSSLTKRYVISHGMLRYILSYYVKQCPQDINFTYNKYGKPFLKGSSIQFNLSHSYNIVSYAIALHCEVGVDIELYNNNLNIQELTDLVFTPTEYSFFSSLKTSEKFKFFYDMWTKKESLVKASGQGLSYPINTIEAMTSSKKILLTKNSEHKQEWHHFPLEIMDGYSASLAVNHAIDQIIYLEMSNQSYIFDKIRLKYL